jgi:hypothetical protein
VEALKSDNMFWRLHAQRLLVERGKDDVASDLAKLIADRSVDETGLNGAAVHALWAMAGLDGWRKLGQDGASTITAALKHPSAGVRRNAILSLPKGSSSSMVLAGLLDDSAPQVRLACVLRLADEPVAASVNDGPDQAGVDPHAGQGAGVREGGGGPLDADAFAAAAARESGPFLEAIAAERVAPPAAATTASVVARVAEHHARGGSSDGLGAILTRLREADPKVRDAVIAGFARGWPKDKPPTLDDAGQKAIAALLPTLSAGSRGQMLGLASRWGVEGLDAFVAALAKDLLASASDEKATEAARLDAARQLIDLRKADPQAARDVIALVTAKTPPDLASGLIAAAATSDAPDVGTALVDAMGPMAPAARNASVLALLGKTDWTNALVGGIEAGKVPMSLLTLSQSQALAAHPDRAIAERARSLLARGAACPTRTARRSSWRSRRSS